MQLASTRICNTKIRPMAEPHELTADLQGTNPSFPFFDIDPCMELTNQYAVPFNPTSFLVSSSLNFQTCMPFSNDSYFSNQNDEAPSEQPPLLVAENEFQESKKIIAMDSSKRRFGIKRNNSSGREKREDEKQKEVGHVRARRGQATDSHSLAERVRRGKIKERLRCLQNIVPGCSKDMSMVVMFDEVINYVQSLQNQVEFLSRKLTAVSSFNDFNSESETYCMETIFQEAKVYEAKELERLKREGHPACTLNGGFNF